MTSEEKQVAFVKQNLDSIIKISLENEGNIDYVQCFVTIDFKVQSAPVFVEGKFNKKKFILLDSLKIKNPESKKIKTVYIRILWSDNHTVWEIKQKVEIFTIPIAGIPNSENLN
jgi:hypothetical protein